MKVGILGGVFNPPHIGHLVAAQEAHAQLGLDFVAWMPAGDPPHREIAQDPGAEARLEMCELAISADARFKLSRMELDRPGRSYTVDTLRQLHDRHADHEFVLVLGGDQAAALKTWRAPEQVLELASVAVYERRGATRADVEAALAGLAGAERLRFLDLPLLDVSSTLVRERAAAGRPIRYLVPDRVADFIDTRNLYGSSVPTA